MKRFFRSWGAFINKHPVWGSVSIIITAILLLLVWGAIQYEFIDRPIFEECMAQTNDYDFCISDPRFQ